MSKKSTRTVSRVAAVQVLYLIDFNKIDPDNETALKETFDEVMSNYEPELHSDNDKKFILNLIEKIFDIENDVGRVISSHLLKQKNIDQLNIMLKSILRCGVCELMHFKTPYKVVVSEYVNIARDFVSPNEVNFTNAILDKIAEHLNRKTPTSQN